MTIRRSILATAFALAVPFAVAAPSTVAIIGAAQADELRPIEGRTFNLGEVSGVVYYTVEREGLHVVATLAQGDSGTPVRIEAILAPGQSVLLCAPRGLGMTAQTVEIRRHDDRILVQAAPVTN
ncbi:MAG: hypothetical protein ACHQHK_07295 [Dongiales bacterium]